MIAKTAKQRRTWVLPAPEGGLDKSDRYEIGIFYELAFIIFTPTLPLRVMFTSHAKPDFFISEDQPLFLAEIPGAPDRRLYPATNKKPHVFKSLWEKNVFTSERKRNKKN